MAAPPIRKSRLSLTEQGRERKQRIKAQHFDPAYMGEGGPLVLYQHCGFTTDAYREGYGEIKWDKPSLP